MEINIISLQSLEGIDFHALVSAYQPIYGSPPWGEYKKCAICGSFWGTHQLDELKALNHTHCGAPIVDYWSKEYLFDSFENISSKPMFSAAIAYVGDSVVGFAWGYEILVEEIDGKDPGLELDGIAAELKKRHGDDLKKIVYLADLAVIPEYRGQGLAKKLAIARHKALLSKNATIIVTRTKGGNDPSITHLWYEKIGFNILIAYNDARLRVIRSININDLVW